jgi:choline-sulfatase
MNVILIVIDALRPDHLGSYGYGRDTSPTIDAFAKEGAAFINTYCTMSRSDGSMTSMLTGQFPHYHGVRLVWGNQRNPNMTALQEILKSHGYATGCIRSPGYLHEGFGKGFDDFDNFSWKVKDKLKRIIYKSTHPGNFLGVAAQRFGTAKKWITNHMDRKFFLMVHSNDLHWPYPVPKPYDHIFDKEYKGEHDFATLCKGQITRGELIFGLKKLPQPEVDHAIAHYDGGIRYIDEHIKKLVEFLKEKNLYEDTLIILTADHGENFGEHDFFFQHGASLYETSLKVPLIFKFPKKIPADVKVHKRVQVLDIMPTVLDILGIPLVDKIEGNSLLPIMQGKPSHMRDFVFMESIEEHFPGNKRVYMKGVRGKWRAMIVGDWKIIYVPHPENNIYELYNLKDDPAEHNNLMDKEPKKAEEMKNKILDYLKSQSNEGDAHEEDLTQKSRKLLIQAGYLE